MSSSALASQRGKLLTIPHMIVGYTMRIEADRALFKKREWTKANERRSREEARRGCRNAQRLTLGRAQKARPSRMARAGQNRQVASIRFGVKHNKLLTLRSNFAELCLGGAGDLHGDVR